jgi:nuclear pore complex protein Nup62
LAEKLQDRLNELNKDLTEMIEEINTTSQTLSKTGKPDDPVSFSFALQWATKLIMQ